MRHRRIPPSDIDPPDEYDELDDNEMEDYDEEDIDNRLLRDWEQASGKPSLTLKLRANAKTSTTNVTTTQRQNSR